MATVIEIIDAVTKNHQTRRIRLRDKKTKENIGSFGIKAEIPTEILLKSGINMGWGFGVLDIDVK